MRAPQLPRSRSAHTNSQQPFGKPARLAGLIGPIALAGATLGLAANSAQALTLFSGAYSPTNWTQRVEGDGSINTSGATTSITLTGADDGGSRRNTDFSIAAPASGTVSFNWCCNTQDTPIFDPFE